VDDQLVADVEARVVVRADADRARARFLDAEVPGPRRAEIGGELGLVELTLVRAEDHAVVDAHEERRGVLDLVELLEVLDVLEVLPDDPGNARVVNRFRRRQLDRRLRLSVTCR
jgi:hypothetical protein